MVKSLMISYYYFTNLRYWHLFLPPCCNPGISKTILMILSQKKPLIADSAKNLNVISDFMITRNETLAVAESVTSGYLQVLLSSSVGASHFYQGGITSYNLNQKARHLSIDPLKALQSNGVSEEVAAQMAIGVTQHFSCDWGIAITGYASPVPEQGIHTLFAFYSFAYKGETLSTHILVSGLKDSVDVQHYYSTLVINNFARYLDQLAMTPAHRDSMNA